jgi:hypothetical protein
VDETLAEVAILLRARNNIDAKLANIIGRPVVSGHLGEWIAARMFDIELEESAARRGIDGHFRSGPLAGRTVNVKWYLKHQGLHDMSKHPLDYYLVLTGPPAPAASSRGMSWPWCVQSAFLFDAAQLHREQDARGVKRGAAASVTVKQWNAAEIYPHPRNALLTLGPDQIEMLKLLHPDVMLAAALPTASAG